MKNIFTIFILSGFLLAGIAPSLEGSSITITVLYDNYPFGEGLKTDWGFSCIIEGTEKTILFDTGGKEEILFHNINKLNINPSAVDLVVISHLHGDHVAALYPFLEKNNKVSVYYPKSYPDSKSVWRDEETGVKMVYQDEPIKICKDVFLTGQMGTKIKEQSLIIDTEKGSIVITGCAHPGIAGIVKRAKELVKKDVYLVFGGFHLVGKSGAEVKEIIRQFKELGVQKVGATHCTGDKAIELFKQAYEENFVQMGVGRVIQIIN